MLIKPAAVLLLTLYLLLSLPVVANETFTYQQGLNDYFGASSTRFSSSRNQDNTQEQHYFRYDGTARVYNLEYFSLPDLIEQTEVESAKLIFYRVGGGIYTGSNIYVRQILDPDNLGLSYANGWKLASGFRAGANVESRDDGKSVDVKWRLSDPDSPDDLNGDYFQGVLKALSESPFFTPQKTDVIGSAYEVDVTADLLCMQQRLCPNHGWALFHANPHANMQNITGSSNYPQIHYRPKLVITYGTAVPVADELEPLVIESFPYNQEVTSTDNKIELRLLTNEAASCRYDLSPSDSFADMRFSLVSVDGLFHSALWPVSTLNTRYQLFGRCRDLVGNISLTPHVYTFTVSEDQASEEEPEEEVINENYQVIDLLPGVTDVRQTLYAIAGQDLVITLGPSLAGDNSPYSYQAEGNAACKASVSGNRCTFNTSEVATALLTVTYSGVSSGSHNIVVVSQENNSRGTTAYIQNKAVIMADYGLAAPDKGETRVDPITGASITRLTDASEIADSEDALIVYSRYSPENSTGDYVLVFGHNSISSRVVNRKTGELVTVLKDENGGTIGENQEVRWDNSGRHPRRIYYVNGMKFWMIDDITKPASSRVLIKDFSDLFPNSTKIYNDVEGDSSNDSDHWAWMAVHYGENDFGSASFLVDAFIHYQISTDTVHSLKPADLAGTNLDREKNRASFTLRPNMVEMSPLGTGLVIHSSHKHNDAEQIRVHYINTWFDGPHVWPLDFDFNRQAPVKISCCASHSGWAFDNQQNEIFISQNNRTDKLDAVKISGDNSGYDQRLMVASHGDFGWNMGFHYGKMPLSKPGWLFYNSYSQDNALWGANQFMMIQLKAETEQPVIWRISPAYNHYDGEYRDEAPAAINLSGNRIYWSSNWGGMLDHREVFMMELPDNWDQALLEPPQ
ncbi:hypothetical protein [Thalassomonas actiniarum]|uniref:Uncharacterized protein n=1 Tax=Thalassomonas actiniarum TaxID=485447 RepID=A0AAE9YQ97_9GAMM|nr:hypothetical protein [Thalassomonas actiniarum]WDD98268.1 hypothetical protein SG35_023805 [Thalassomonas actiniarum]